MIFVIYVTISGIHLDVGEQVAAVKENDNEYAVVQLAASNVKVLTSANHVYNDGSIAARKYAELMTALSAKPDNMPLYNYCLDLLEMVEPMYIKVR